MKLLLDENLSRRIVPFLQSDYPGSTQIALLGMERANDREVWQYAKENGYVIVTKDSDFYDLSLLYGPPPKIVWLKTGNVTKSAVTHLLLNNRETIQSLLAQNEISCVEIY